MGKRQFWSAVLLMVCAAFASAEGTPLRLEAVGTYHYNGGAQAEWAFPFSSSAIGVAAGASYGIRDYWNSVSAGAAWYPLSAKAQGLFADVQETYGFGIPAVQGDSGQDWKTAMTIGYRWMAFGWLTGSIAAGVNYDVLVVAPPGGPGDFNGGAQKGLNPALAVTLGMALDPRP